MRLAKGAVGGTSGDMSLLDGGDPLNPRVDWWGPCPRSGLVSLSGTISLATGTGGLKVSESSSRLTSRAAAALSARSSSSALKAGGGMRCWFWNR